MNGILVVNKPSGYTSRDVVNVICKKFGTKKVGHMGTLDPLAKGVLVVAIGKALKIVELLSNDTKVYVADVILGYETDTLDVSGVKVKKNGVNVSKDDIERVLGKFIGKYLQEVPLYSAVKVNGKKLYEYARRGIDVKAPSKEVEIFSLELLDAPKYLDDVVCFRIKCKVSKGTYIRSLIRDIGYELNTYGTMGDLIRIEQGKFSLDDASSLEDILNDHYKLFNIRDVLDDIDVTLIDDDILKKVLNGMTLPCFFDGDMSILVDKNNREIAIYKRVGNMVVPYKMIEVNNE